MLKFCSIVSTVPNYGTVGRVQAFSVVPMFWGGRLWKGGGGSGHHHGPASCLGFPAKAERTLVQSPPPANKVPWQVCGTSISCLASAQYIGTTHLPVFYLAMHA